MAADIQRLLPHRGAALFLDEAEVFGSSARGSACWRGEHPHLQGHFPGQPVVPGVYLLEAAAQLAGVAALAGDEAASQGRTGVLAAVRKSLFHRLVRPGERVHYTLDVRTVSQGAMVQASGSASVAEHKVLTVELTVALVAASALQPINGATAPQQHAMQGVA